MPLDRDADISAQPVSSPIQAAVNELTVEIGELQDAVVALFGTLEPVRRFAVPDRDGEAEEFDPPPRSDLRAAIEKAAEVVASTTRSIREIRDDLEL